MTFPRNMAYFNGQRTVKNVLGLDIYIHWQTRGCGSNLDTKKTLVSSALVIDILTCVLLGLAIKLSYAIILLNYVLKKLFILRLGC
jgi:hypothetical protein